MKDNIPAITKIRYTQYLRALYELKERGNERILSYQIGSMVEVSASTVRKDFMYLNYIGKSAYGYNINDLIKALEAEIGLTKKEKIILIGAGSLGHALIKYNFNSHKIGKIVAAFDCDKTKIGTKIYGVTVHDISKIKRKIPKDTKIAILTVPKEEVDPIINTLISLNVEAIINFSDAIPRRRKKIKIYSVDLVEIISKAIYDFKK